MVISRTKALKPLGYPGAIMWCKFRFGYGQQSLSERWTILQTWYSNLAGFLPIYCRNKKLDDKDMSIINDGLVDAARRIEACLEAYDPAFEGLTTCTGQEKKFIRMMAGIVIVLDVITATSGVVDEMPVNDEGGFQV